MWVQVFDAFLEHLIRQGRLTVTLPSGRTQSYGSGEGAPEVAITLHDDTLPRKIVLSPDMAVGEAYMDGRLTIAGDDLRGFLSLALINIHAQGQPWFRRPLEYLRVALRHLKQFNPASRARANVAHHYDLSGELYDLFLDADRQYSCAYFSDPGMTLEAAQEAKKHHIARKLLIEPGMRVLDIGCGWGGMGLTLARDYGAEVTGITLSTEQHAMANRRAEEAGLAQRAKFLLTDYRDITGEFDRIVSVGMFEHVGVPHYETLFPQPAPIADPRGRGAHPHHRPVRAPRLHLALDHQIHLPRRLCPGHVGNPTRHRTSKTGHHRCRGLAAALCRNAEPLAQPFRGQYRPRPRAL